MIKGARPMHFMPNNRFYRSLLGIAATLGVIQVLLWSGSSSAPAAAFPLAVISAQGETVPVASRGDAADDPAIWYNADAPERSLVLGTDKKRGLEVYDLQGNVCSPCRWDHSTTSICARTCCSTGGAWTSPWRLIVRRRAWRYSRSMRTGR
ncbi:phytase [Billgrantia tianxiuensis]|uniref:Phytase n=1 Tax=Billgrantia tianxiuensis TaxID=2497861 RepID=A0A6I6SGC4_9GAMM|nr:phytase [Halomonas tianxiuensis]